MALVFLVNIPFLFNNLAYFISERFFSQNDKMTKNRETHGRTVRVGRSGSVEKSSVRKLFTPVSS